MTIEPGKPVIAILHTPREKLFGILDEIASSGVYLRAVELSYFEDWMRAIAEDEPYLPMSDQFLPMWRLERLTHDESTIELATEFESRTGRRLSEM